MHVVSKIVHCEHINLRVFLSLAPWHTTIPTGFPSLFQTREPLSPTNIITYPFLYRRAKDEIHKDYCKEFNSVISLLHKYGILPLNLSFGYFDSCKNNKQPQQILEDINYGDCCLLRLLFCPLIWVVSCL